jgi:hypothetical protein
MLKKVLLISAILVVAISFLYILKIAPYHIYNLTLTEGVNTKFLKMNPTSKIYYNGNQFKYFNEEESFKKSNNILKLLHVSNFELLLPLNHPSFSFIPSIKIESGRIKLGGSFIDLHSRELFEFVIENEFKFETKLINQEIYLLPFFRNYIESKDQNEIWKDIFLKPLSLPSNEGKSFYESLEILNKYEYKELVYNLFILNNRVRLLPGDVQNISYEEDSNLGILKIKKDENTLIERIYYLNQGFVYPITIMTNLNSPIAMYTRNKFIQKLKFKSSSKDSSVALYSDYKNLKYQDRIDEKGMVLLYSAWSHDLDNKEYIRVIINFLERGNSNIKYLRPFYEYAYKKFGSSFSETNEFLIENTEEKLKRKMKNELDLELAKEENKKLNQNNDTNSIEEKINQNLLKAKEKKMNTDDTLKELRIE